jgi:type VI secretion system secreted protein Hcp
MAAVDYFLRLDGIEGESKDDVHQKAIELESWSWGGTQSGNHETGGGGGAGKIWMQDFMFLMKVNKASPKLMLACATGEHIKEALLICRKAGSEPQEFFKVKLSGLLVSSYQTGGDESDIVPLDQVTLNYSKIEVEYKPQNPDGSLGGAVKAGYDLKVNKKV